MLRIESVHNERVLGVARLRDRRERERTGRIVINGAREVARALAGRVRIVEGFVAPELATSDEARAAAAALVATGRVVEVSQAAFVRMAYGDRHDGVLAVAETPATGLAALELPPEPLVAVLEGVEKPGNLGAVLRSADGAGVDAVVLADPRTDPWNPNAIRASLGTIFHVPLAVAPGDEVRAWLAERRLAIVAARLEDAEPYSQVALAGPLAIVLGAESVGLSPAWLGPQVRGVRLPMLGIADSLNVSAAAAVLFYEARRQRDERAGPAAPSG
ncbi:MAG TPA: TrmH family RNA methyltransferase [Candidatus Limnocylindrales bacterium]|nr:TrmH family RNA methyltransferase [Candidatus Limnocylindrales bacterium]